MWYDEYCVCCNKEVEITGGYIGILSDVYCKECGYAGEDCGGDCDLPPEEREGNLILKD